jgi:hypothetical protein
MGAPAAIVRVLSSRPSPYFYRATNTPRCEANRPVSSVASGRYSAVPYPAITMTILPSELSNLMTILNSELKVHGPVRSCSDNATHARGHKQVECTRLITAGLFPLPEKKKTCPGAGPRQRTIHSALHLYSPFIVYMV